MIHGEQLCSIESYFGKTVALKKVKNKPKTGLKTGVAQEQQ